MIEQIRPSRRALIAVDGPHAAGKSSLVHHIAAGLVRPTVCVSVDSWHYARDVRLRRGVESAEGYYRDSFNYEALVLECLLPFASGAQRVRTAGVDYLADGSVETRQDVAADAVLLIDGVFLLRPELREQWDLSVYLHVPESVTLARAVQRDLELFGSEEEVRRRYRRRYLPGQALYRQEAQPLDHADLVLDNSHPEDAVVLRWPGKASASRDP